MTTAALSAFDLSIRADEPAQLNFIAQIPLILIAFRPDWISTQFLPFLAKWVPPNNHSVVTALLSTVPRLIELASLDAATPLFEAVFSADDTDRTTALVSIILKFTVDQTAAICLTRLSRSTWDCVRAVVPRLIGVVKGEEVRHQILKSLLEPGAPFKVRYAVARSVPDLSDSLARLIVGALLDDPNGRIRGILPLATAPRSFFFEIIAPAAAGDLDWVVRGSVASALINTGDPPRAIPIGVKLLEDAVWQVKLCALRSLTDIIRKLDQEVQISEADRLRILIAHARTQYQIVTLKKAIIDLFIVMYARAPVQTDEAFVAQLLATEEGAVQLYFLTAAVRLGATELIPFEDEQILRIVTRLSKSEHWSERLGLVELLTELAAVPAGQELREHFAELCFTMLRDEASPVRRSAAKQLATIGEVALVDGKLPPQVLELAESRTFRDRQAAVMLIRHIYAQATAEEDKEVLRAQLERFTAEGEALNVVSLALDVISELNQ
jgi:HEAT repeat protein